MKTQASRIIWSAVMLLGVVQAASAANYSFTGGTYSQDFNTLDSSTMPPTGWNIYNLNNTLGHDTFSYWTPTGGYVTQLPTSGAIAGTAAGFTLTQNNTLIVQTDPTTQKSSQGYNFGQTSSGTADRCIGTSPTGIAAMLVQLGLTNNSGGNYSSVNISYDIRRFTACTANNTAYNTGPTSGVEELPGYWIWYSQDNGTSWTNVNSLNPTLAGPGGVVMPNAVGVTNVPVTNIALASTWTNGSNLLFRWMDDNGQSPSPDQIIGIDNVVVTATPEPATLTLLGLGGMALLRRRRAGR
jgi:hypothetical protein